MAGMGRGGESRWGSEKSGRGVVLCMYSAYLGTILYLK